MSEIPVGLSAQPEGYSDWLSDLKGRIHGAQQRATLAVNRELVLLYWQIGHDILTRQTQQGWGTKVIERLALVSPIGVAGQTPRPRNPPLVCRQGHRA